jgi:hypothetical protein
MLDLCVVYTYHTDDNTYSAYVVNRPYIRAHKHISKAQALDTLIVLVREEMKFLNIKDWRLL